VDSLLKVSLAKEFCRRQRRRFYLRGAAVFALESLPRRRAKKKKKTMSGGGRDLTSLFARMRRGDAEAVKGAMTAQARRA